MTDSDQEIWLRRWAHPSRILVATNLSDLDRLLPFAVQQAKETNASLVLLHTVPASATLPMDGPALPYYDPSAALEFAAKQLQPYCNLARFQGVPCEAVVREGHAARQIAEAALQFNADRVLVGTRSRSKLGKLFLGSVAEQVLRTVAVPVMTVGPDAHPQLTAEGQRVVLHAVSLREASPASAALACHIAAAQGAMLELLHVLPPLEEPRFDGYGGHGQPASLDSAALHELRLLAMRAGVGCCTAIEARVIHGNPNIEILAEASERGASLIVMGASDRNPLKNLTRDRTIYRVLAHARCPVLTLRETQGFLNAQTINTTVETMLADQKSREDIKETTL